MNDISVVSSKQFKPTVEYGIEDGMLKLCEYGKPRLTSFGNGRWHCAIDVFCNGKGVEFKIASEFGEPSMVDAVRSCISRLHDALKSLGVSV